MYFFEMFQYDFMQNAFIAGAIIGIISGLMSFFVIIRRASFASHALGHISLTGASGAVLIGLSAMTGQLLANLLAGFIMGLMGDKIKNNDVSVGIVLTFFLGLGAYFLFLYQTGYAGSIMNILFGSILTVSITQIYILSIISLIVFIGILIIAKSLYFCSLDATLAESKKIPVRFLSVIFFLLLALTVTMACQIVGVLLIFALLVGPAAISFQWSQGFYKPIILSIITAILVIFLSLTIAFYYDLPVSFLITLFISVGYLVGLIKIYLFNS